MLTLLYFTLLYLTYLLTYLLYLLTYCSFVAASRVLPPFSHPRAPRAYTRDPSTAHERCSSWWRFPGPDSQPPPPRQGVLCAHSPPGQCLMRATDLRRRWRSQGTGALTRQMRTGRVRTRVLARQMPTELSRMRVPTTRRGSGRHRACCHH